MFAGASTVAKGIKAGIRCFGVEPETGDDTRRSFNAGERVTIPPPPTIADGARLQSPGALTFPFVERYAEDVLTVSDTELVEAMKLLLFRLKILVEPTGALGAAAVLFNKLPANIRRIGVVISGGNVDADVFARVLAAG